MDNLRTAIRMLMAEAATPAPGARLRVVEPVALNRVNGSGSDTFGDGDVLVFAGSDGIMLQVRSPTTGLRYAISPSQFERSMAPVGGVGKAGSKAPAARGKPVPATLRGKKMT